MAGENKKIWVDYTVFGLSIFLVFCLLFESYIELPNLIAWIGRWHPLVLHFPIVLLLIAIFLGLRGKDIPNNLLVVATIGTLVTAISGFFLGSENTPKGDLLFWHEWLGSTLALAVVLWYWLEGMQLGKKVYSKALQILIVGLVGFTGHYGGMVTHGEDFLALPTEKRQKKIPENPLIYHDVVGRILENNCMSCHNPNKQKGELLMTNLEELLKGGEVGNTVIPGDAGQSEIIKRLHLPKEDVEHMPPDGKKPLNDLEIQILERWIDLGASDTMRLDHLEDTEPLVNLVRGLMEPDPMENWAKLPKVADSTLQNLSTDYITINRVASNSHALSVNVFLSPKFDSLVITNLQRLAKNIVELDLSGLPIGQNEMNMVSSCSNLEWLEIDGTPITDTQVEVLRNLRNIRLLKIYDTKIGDKSIPVFKELQSLKSLYLWKTDISEAALESLRLSRPSLLINSGIDNEIKTFFVETDSITNSK